MEKSAWMELDENWWKWLKWQVQWNTFIGLNHRKLVKARIWKSLNHNCRHFSHSSLKILQSDREYLSVSDSTSPKLLLFSSTSRWSSPSSYSVREEPARWRRGCRARGSPESCSTSSSPDFRSWFCHIVTFPVLLDFTSSHLRSNSSASVTLWSWEAQNSNT